MRSNLRLIAATLSLSVFAIWTVGCSAAPDKAKSSTLDVCSKKSSSSSCNDDDNGNNNNNNNGSNITGSPTAAGVPVTDAAAPPPKPTPSSGECKLLSTCCSTLSDFGDEISCIGVTLAGNEPSCQAARIICKAGGAGIGDKIGSIFSDSNPKCAKLSKCCSEFSDQGYDVTASDCRDWVSYEDEASCGQQLSDYQDYGSCTSF